MRYEKIWPQTLDEMLIELVSEIAEYSFALGDWGKYLWISIQLKDKGYIATSSGVKPSEIERYESQVICTSCFEKIYISSYYYPEDNYHIKFFNSSIEKLMGNMRRVKNIRDIENLAIDIYNIVVDSYLDTSKKYNKISIYFERKVPDDEIIFEEIERSIIDRQFIDDMFKFPNPPVFMFTTLKEEKEDTNGNKIKPSYPNYYKFIFAVYEGEEKR
jgi:hypothetical protein